VIAPDVNVLLYALRQDAERHDDYRAWLEGALNGAEPVALLEPILAGLMRIGTHPKIYKVPTPRSVIDAFIDACVDAPSAIRLRADQDHFDLFRDLCRRADCRGNLVQDAYLAALALEHNVTFVTTDRDFSRFPRLRWQHPLDDRMPRTNPV
jgi:toxin-antitoxin system PIN domain toxin